MLTNEAAAAEAETVPPVPVAPGLAEVAALVADPGELQAASVAARAARSTVRASRAPLAGIPRRRPRLVSSSSPMKLRLSRRPHYSQ